MSKHDPVADLAERYPDYILHVADLYPAHATVIPQHRVILLDFRLTMSEQRCALAHEIAHIDLDHRRQSNRWFGQRQEREADRMAARRLISPTALLSALALSADDLIIADSLAVDLPTLLVRMSCLHPAERHAIEHQMRHIESVA